MEDPSEYTRASKLEGMTEVFRIYYDKHSTCFDEILYLEHVAILAAILSKCKIFKALPSTSLGPLMVCKN